MTSTTETCPLRASRRNSAVFVARGNRKEHRPANPATNTTSASVRIPRSALRRSIPESNRAAETASCTYPPTVIAPCGRAHAASRRRRAPGTPAAPTSTIAHIHDAVTVSPPATPPIHTHHRAQGHQRARDMYTSPSHTGTGVLDLGAGRPRSRLGPGTPHSAPAQSHGPPGAFTKDRTPPASYSVTRLSARGLAQVCGQFRGLGMCDRS